MSTIQDSIEEYYKQGLFSSILELNCSNRINKALEAEGIFYFGDLISYSNRGSHFYVPNLGEVSQEELLAKICEKGLDGIKGLELWRSFHDRFCRLDEDRLAELPDLAKESYYYKNFAKTSLAYKEQRAAYIQTPLADSLRCTFENIKSDRKQIIINLRFGMNGTVETYLKAAEIVGITHSQVANIENGIVRRIKDTQLWPLSLELRIKNLLLNHDHLFIDELSQLDNWFAGFSDNIKTLEQIIFFFLRVEGLRLTSRKKRKVILADRSINDLSKVSESFSNEHISSILKGDVRSSDDEDVRRTELETYLSR